jgi:hypothetical protein
MKTIINFFKWFISLFVKKQIKEIENTLVQVNFRYDKKYSGKRRYTKAPVWM